MSNPSYTQANPLIPPGFGGVPLPTYIPTPVQRAFLILMIVIGLGVLSTLVGVVSGSSSIASLVGSLLLSAVGVFFALHFRGGRNWARVVVTVLTAIALFFYVLGVFASLFALVILPVAGLVLLAISAVGLVAGVLVLVNSWKAEAGAYFARMAV